MRKRTAWILAAAIAAVALGAAAVGAVALVVRAGGSASWGGGDRYLSLEISGDVSEEPATGLDALFDSGPPSIHEMVAAVDRAAGDPGVKGLVLRVGPTSLGWARLDELRDALVRFSARGKPTWAHLEFAGTAEYYLASGCRHIAVAPTAMLDVSGLAAEVTFYKGSLDKLGVQAQFEGVGKYKNAPNQFTETSFTEPHREQMEALVASLFETWVEGVAEARKLDAVRVRALVDEAPFDARRAREAGLVDELLYRDEVESRVGGGSRVGVGRYSRGGGSGFSFSSRPKLALVYAVGTIVPGDTEPGLFGGGLVGSDTVVRGLRQASEDEGVRAILLRVDSPGGSGTASDAVWREVARARKSKPVVVSMGDYAASGGYYIAMNADAIVAQPGTLTGSIGVFSGKFSLKGLYEKLGMSEGVVQRGRYARLFSGSEPWSEDERRRVQQLNRTFYDTFVAKAAEGRRRSVEEIEKVAQGRVWTGAEALRAGLVDALGGLDLAVAMAREKAHLPEDGEVTLVVMPAPKGFFESLTGRTEEASATRLVGQPAARLLTWTHALAGGGPIARLPFELRVR